MKCHRRIQTNESCAPIDALEARQLFSFAHAGPPQPPSSITATADDRAPYIRVTWSDSSSKEAGYTLQRRKGRHGAWVTVATLPANTTYYRNARLPKGTAYIYRVAAFNRAGSSQFVGPAGAMTEGGIPLPPNNAPTLGGTINDPDLRTAVRVANGGPLVSVDYTLSPGPNGPIIRAFGSLTVPNELIDINSELQFPMNSATGLAVQSDGKIIVAGNGIPNAGGGSNIIVARFNTDGSRDNTFNVGTGEFNADFGNGEHVADLALAPDGGIYVAGDHTVYGSNGNTHEFFTVRLTSAGITDNNYGFGGISKGDPHGNVTATAIAVDPSDGSVVIVGGSAADFSNPFPVNLEGTRLLPDGTATNSFTIPSDGSATGVVVQADHKIVVVGQNFLSPLTSRRNADGTADTTWFGPAPLPLIDGIFNAVVQLTDGTFIVAGIDTAGSDIKAIIARLNTDGSPDGYVLAGVPDNNNSIDATYNALTINLDGSSPNGSIVAAGGNHNTLLVDYYGVPTT